MDKGENAKGTRTLNQDRSCQGSLSWYKIRILCRKRGWCGRTMRGYVTLAIRYSLGLAVSPRASSGPAPVVASRERPLLSIISDPPWFPHPFPFVWLFYNEKKKSIVGSTRDVTRTCDDGWFFKRSRQFVVYNISESCLMLVTRCEYRETWKYLALNVCAKNRPALGLAVYNYADFLIEWRYDYHTAI